MDRRSALRLLGLAGVAAVAAACGRSSSRASGASGPSSPGSTTASGAACTLTPEATEGPYYLDVDQVRSDITEGRPGTPLALAISVVDVASCAPLRDAAVDVWHTDASGTYSGVDGDRGTFMRGTQVTGENGNAQFTTVYPGWYQGRAVHIHLKVHAGGNVVHTGQLFFPDDLTDAVYERAPYNDRGERDTRNQADSIFTGSGGAATTLAPARRGNGYPRGRDRRRPAHVIERRAARVIVVDPDGRILLLSGGDPDRPEAGRFWFTPGGGLDDGESHEAAARREVREETGLHIEDLGAAVFERRAEFQFDGEWYDQSEQFFFARVETFDVVYDGWTDIERRFMFEHRWWTLDELQATEERFYPEQLYDIVTRLIAEGR